MFAELDFSMGPAALWLFVCSVSSLGLSIIALLVLLTQKKIKIHQQWEEDVQRSLAEKQSEIQSVYADLLAKKDVELTRLSTLNEHITQRQRELQDEVGHLQQMKDEYLQLKARYAEREASLKDQEELLQATKQALFKEFEFTANRLFEAKQQIFEKNNRQGVENLLKPFREQLHAFGHRVNQIYDQESSQRNQLVGQLLSLQKQTQKVSQDAENLAKALKGNNKMQGDWGEMILERILEQSGLRKGVEYDTQVNLRDAQGKLYRPDIVIHLPDGKDIIVDAKVSLIEYERHCSLDDEQQRQAALKQHVDSIRLHVKALAAKQYEQLNGINSIDYILAFIPIEPAFNAALSAQPGLLTEAAEKRVLLVSPTSILVAVRTIETLWRHYKQDKNAEIIAQSAGRLYDQFALVMESLQELGHSLNKASTSYDQLFNRFTRGRGNLVKRVESLKELGAKTSRDISAFVDDESALPEALRVSDALQVDEQATEQQ